MAFQLEKYDLISVIVTCFNRENYVADALESIYAQSYPNFEIIFVDDGSTDGSKHIALRYGEKLRYYYQENQGASAAKNIGVELARGRFIAFLDSDDLWTPDKLTRQLDYKLTYPHIDVLYAHGRQFISPEIPEDERKRLHCPVNPMPAPISGALFVEKETFLRVGPFRPDLRVGIDVEWNLRARDLGLRVSIMPQILLHRRIHKSNSGLTQKIERHQHVGIVKEHLNRMRQFKKDTSLSE